MALCASELSTNNMALDLQIVTRNKLSKTRFDQTAYNYVFSVIVQNSAQAVNNSEHARNSRCAQTYVQQLLI